MPQWAGLSSGFWFREFLHGGELDLVNIFLTLLSLSHYTGPLLPDFLANEK